MSTAQTFTVLVTITGRQPADAQAMADRIAAHLTMQSTDWAPYEEAAVDAFDGSHVRVTSDQSMTVAVRAHHAIRNSDTT